MLMSAEKIKKISSVSEFELKLNSSGIFNLTKYVSKYLISVDLVHLLVVLRMNRNNVLRNILEEYSKISNSSIFTVTQNKKIKIYLGVNNNFISKNEMLVHGFNNSYSIGPKNEIYCFEPNKIVIIKTITRKKEIPIECTVFKVENHDRKEWKDVWTEILLGSKQVLTDN